MSTATIDTSKMRQTAYRAIYGSEDIGATTNGSTNIVIGPNRVAIEDAEQARGAIKLWRVGTSARVEMSIKEIAPSVLSKILLPGLKVVTNGGKTAYKIGNDQVDQDPFAKQLKLQPVGQDLSNSDDSWVFWKAVSVQEFTYTGNNETPQEVGIVFEILPDFTKDISEQIGCHNNSEIDQGVPLGTWIAFSDRAQTPPIHNTAFDLALHEVQQLNGFELTADISTSITAQLDGAVTASADTITVKNLSVDNGIVSGDMIMIDNAGAKEIVQITSVTRLSATAATYGVSRGIAGSTAAAHLTDLTFEKLEKCSIFNRTLDGTWTLAGGTSVTVGNDYTNNSNTKGKITHATAGVSTITFTFGTKVSPVTTITGL